MDITGNGPDVGANVRLKGSALIGDGGHNEVRNLWFPPVADTVYWRL